MKELSIEEKAKLYDKAIERAKYYQKENGSAVISAIFPELKESGDERIIERIKKAVESYWSDEPLDEILSWLEKQDEQKPVVIIPKFRVGDEIKTSNEESLTITKIDEKGYWSEDLFICCFDEECVWDLVEQNPAWSEKYIADVFEKVGLAKIAREQSNDVLTNALQDAMIELSKFLPQQSPAEKYNITGIGSKNAQGKLGEMIKNLRPVNLVLAQDSVWSEEDAKALNRISTILVEASEVKNWWKEDRLIERDEMIRLTDFLKSLRPQNRWKPSDEQMGALDDVISSRDIKYDVLSELWKDLKKLRNE